MKHILEWYKELPEPYRSAAIANYDETRVQTGPYGLRHGVVDTLAEAVWAGFGWSKAGDIPGALPWARLYDQLLEGTFNPNSYPQIKTTFLEGMDI